MECRNVQDWLFQADDPRADAAEPAVAQHLIACEACLRLSGQLIELEDAWRALPLPVQTERAKAALMRELQIRWAARPGPRTLSRRRILQWSAGAAATLLAAGAGGWFFFASTQAQADEELLDRLVEWNLRLSHAQSGVDRKRLYAEQAEQLRARIARLRMSSEQASLAAGFLENGEWLVDHSDPFGEADRFVSLADRLLQIADDAGKAGNYRRTLRFLRQYNRVLESGVELNVARAEATGALDLEHQKRLERLTFDDPKRIQRLAQLLKNSPHASRKEIERALGLYQKRGKKPDRG